jgi:hypothetical protein
MESDMDAERIGKARGQFSLRARAALKPLEMYGQKACVDGALEILRMLNDIAIYESAGETPPENLVKKLADWQTSFQTKPEP